MSSYFLPPPSDSRTGSMYSYETPSFIEGNVGGKGGGGFTNPGYVGPYPGAGGGAVSNNVTGASAPQWDWSKVTEGTVWTDPNTGRRQQYSKGGWDFLDAAYPRSRPGDPWAGTGHAGWFNDSWDANWWSQQPKAVQQLQFLTGQERINYAKQLADQGFSIPGFLGLGGSPYANFNLLGQYGYSWVPNANQPTQDYIKIAPGLYDPYMKPEDIYNPNVVPQGAVALPSQFYQNAGIPGAQQVQTNYGPLTVSTNPLAPGSNMSGMSPAQIQATTPTATLLGANNGLNNLPPVQGNVGSGALANWMDMQRGGGQSGQAPPSGAGQMTGNAYLDSLTAWMNQNRPNQTPTTGNTTPPTSNTTPTTGNTTPPTGNTTPSTGSGTSTGSSGAGMTPDQWLAAGANDLDWLRNYVKNAGLPTDATQAWLKMIEAQERQKQRNFADLQESFNVAGNRFSTSFGNAATDYLSQTTKDQSALLGQMTLASQEAARARELQAAMGLGGFGFQGASQLSNQSFQAQMAAMQQALQAAMGLTSAQGSAASQLNSGAIQAALALLSGSNNAASSIFGNENNAAQQQIMLQQALKQMGLQGATNLSQLWQSNLNLGSMLGGQQYGIGQDQLNRLYQEWMRTQAAYNPLLPYLSQGAFSYPALFYPQFQPSQLPATLGGIGSLIGGASQLPWSSIWKALQGIFNFF